jgi:glycosyltransferase involved in cell wall biosynthesis
MVIGWGADPQRVQVIYNALDASNYQLTLSREAARQQLGWSSENHYLLTVARLTAWKGVDYLIDALVHLPDIRLVVAGDGPQLNVLQTRAVERNIANRIIFLGKVPHDHIPLYVRAADYLVLYSGYEGLSHTILEALYAGTPVIASQRGGNPEIVRNGENGLLVKHPDLDALVAVLKRAFEVDMQHRLAANTRQGLERFSWPQRVEQTVASLCEVAQCTS